MTAEELLAKLEHADLVAPGVVASLRKQVAAAPEPIAASAITKLLVEKGHLTAGQAQRLIGAPAASGIGKAAASPAAAKSTIQKAAASSAVTKAAAASQTKPALAPAAKATSLSSSSVFDDLGLAPLEELEPTKEPAKSAIAATTSAPKAPAKPAAIPKSPPPSAALLDDLGLAPLEELELPSPPSATKTETAKAAATKVAPAAKSTIQKAETKPAAKKPAATEPAPLAELSPLDDLGGGLEPLGDLSALDSPGFDALTPLDAGPLGATADLGALAAQSAATARPQALAAATAAKQAAAANESRTTLFVGLGLGGAALLVVVIGLAVFLWPRGTGQKEFAAAEQAFQEKQYTAALEQYDELLRLHPRHEQLSLIRVHRGWCLIQLANLSPADYERLLPVVTSATNEIAAEPALPQLHPELAPLLVQMTEALTDLATTAKPAEKSEQRLKAARAAVFLCNDSRLLPSNLRPWQKLAEIEERLKLAEREQNREAVYQRAKNSMLTTLTETHDFAAYVKQRNELLAQYPELATDFRLMMYAEAAHKSVKHSSEKRAAEKSAAESPVLASVPWQMVNERFREEPAAGGERVVLVTAAGGVHALDRETGQRRWSRYLASSAGERPLVSSDGRTAWLIDRRLPELSCVNALSGRLNWRQPLAASPVGAPLLLGERIYVSQSGGIVKAFDSTSGELQAQATLPQQLPPVGPIASNDGKFILQIADEGIIYVLAADDLRAGDGGAILQGEGGTVALPPVSHPEEVDAFGFVGHERGTVTLPPQVFAKYLITTLRRGEQTEISTAGATVVAGPEPKPGEAFAPVLPNKRQFLEGAIAGPLQLVGKRWLMPLQNGGIHVLEFDPAATEPFHIVQTLPPPSGSPVIRSLQNSPNGILAADRGLQLLKFDAAGKLQPGWSAFPGDILESAGTLTDSLCVTVRYVPDQQALYAAAVDLADGRPLWQTPLAVPFTLVSPDKSTEPIAFAAPTITQLLATEGNDLTADFKRLLTATPPANRKALPIEQVLSHGPERLFVPARSSRELLFVNPADLSVRKLNLPGELAGRPAIAGQNLLVPLADGSIRSLDLAAGTETAAPFVLPGGSIKTELPIAVIALGEDGKGALVCDGHRAVYRIALFTEPKPHWVEEAAAQLDEPLAALPEVVGGLVLAVDRRGQAHSFTLPDLDKGAVVDLKGQVTWGPHRAGECLLLATDRDELWCFDAAREPHWRQAISGSSLVGLPLLKDGQLIITSLRGSVEVRDAASGNLLGSADLQHPLAGSALLSGNQLWLSTASGQVLRAAVPTTTNAAEQEKTK